MSLCNDKKVYNIILQKAVKEEIEKIAKLEDRSCNNLINLILKRFIEDYDSK